jgi:hypothetical protein
MLLASNRANVVREKPMEANIAESELDVAAFELRLPIGTERKRSMTTADDVLPAMRKLGTGR